MWKRWTNAGVIGAGLLLGCEIGCQPDRGAAQAGTMAASGNRSDAVATHQTATTKEAVAVAWVADKAAGLEGGCLIGMSRAMLDGNRHDLAKRANDDAQQRPATLAEVRDCATADLNNDGFVTLDEVVAMRRAGLDDTQMIQRLEATHQVFAVSPRQRQYLLDRGVGAAVIDRIVSPAGVIASSDRIR